ncbi:MAG: anti-sigma factor [Devosia sp.]|nr:anti-sigma factor [Devosia sp.]
MSDSPITEDDLNGYVDETLAAERQAEVTAYLAQHPAVAARVETYVRQRDMLRAALAPIAEEPLPPELNLRRMIELGPRQRRTPRLALLAASVALVMIGAASGWSLRGMAPSPTEATASLASEAADTYAVYAPDAIRPVELRASDQDRLVSWASERLGLSVTVPDLTASGYRFMGGRVTATAHGPALMYMYDNDRGTRLVMLLRSVSTQQNLPMSQHKTGDVDGFAWANKGVGYSLVGPTAPDLLHSIANEARHQIDSRA